MPSFHLNERDLVFTFDVARYLRWDGHPAQRHGVGRLPNAKAADVCVVLHDGSAVLVEITDYRGYGAAANRAIRGGELVTETSQKVRDSLAGLIWAARRALAPEDWFDGLVGGFVNRTERKLRVVLWLEGVDAAVAATMAKEIEAELKPAIAAKVVVTNRALEASTSHPFAWVRAEGAPGAIR